MSDDEIIVVVQAHKDGRQIEVQAINGSGAWMSATCPVWDFYRSNFRVKPELPKPREWWIACDQIDADGRLVNPLIHHDQINSNRKVIHVREVID